MASTTKATQPVQSADVRATLKWGGTEETEFGTSMTRKLVAYVAASRVRLKGCDVVGLPTDKGCGVGGQSLQNTLMCVPDGYAYLAPPQVFVCMCVCIYQGGVGSAFQAGDGSAFQSGDGSAFVEKCLAKGCGLNMVGGFPL